MASKFKKGQEVKVAAIIPQGPIQAFRMDEEGTVFCLISWEDAQGNTHERWFEESQLVEA